MLERLKKLKNIKLSRFGKRQLILAGLMVMIAVAGYINLNYDPGEALPASTELADPMPSPDITAVPSAAPAADAFAEARLEREKSRSQSMDVYRELINSDESDKDVKKQAQQDLSDAAKAIENETSLESLIKAKGFDNAVVYISSGGVNVMVKSEGLTPAQVAQIKDMVVETTGRAADQIKISEIR